MNIQGMSNEGVLMIYRAIGVALEKDLANPEKADPYFGVREYGDWPQWRDILEAEIVRRKLQYTQIRW